MTALPFYALCIDELPYDALVGVVKGCKKSSIGMLWHLASLMFNLITL